MLWQALVVVSQFGQALLKFKDLQEQMFNYCKTLEEEICQTGSLHSLWCGDCLS